MDKSTEQQIAKLKEELFNEGRRTSNAQQELRESKMLLEKRDNLIAELEGDKQKLVSLVLRMIDRWWCFVHNATFPSDAARNLLQEASETLANLKRK